VSGRRPRRAGPAGLLLGAAVLLLAPAAVRLEAQQQQQQPQEPQQSSEADIFNTQTFDQSVAASRKQEQANKLEYLVGGVFLLDNTFLTPQRFDGYTAVGQFAAKAFARLSVPSYGMLYLGYNLSHGLYQGDGGALDSTVPTADLFESAYELSEFYLSFDLGKKVFLRLGNQLLAWGPSVIWTPVDFVNLQRLNPLAIVDLRVGKPGLRVHVPMKNSNLFLFADFSRTVDVAELDVNDLARTALAARWDWTVLGCELGLSGYFGQDLPGHFGLDLSGRLLGFDVYGEAALTADFPAGTQDYAVSAGFQRSFGDLKEWSVQGEAFYQSAGQPDASGYAALAAAGKFTPFYLGRWYAFAALTKQNLFADFLDATLSGFLNASDLSYLVRLAAAFDIPGAIPFTFTLGYAGGGEGKEFTWYSGGNAFSASLQVRFEF
jgi:hypothetical protein